MAAHCRHRGRSRNGGRQDPQVADGPSAAQRCSPMPVRAAGTGRGRIRRHGVRASHPLLAEAPSGPPPGTGWPSQALGSVIAQGGRRDRIVRQLGRGERRARACDEVREAQQRRRLLRGGEGAEKP
jgi:hypothetical protein